MCLELIAKKHHCCVVWELVLPCKKLPQWFLRADFQISNKGDPMNLPVIEDKGVCIKMVAKRTLYTEQG